MKERYLSKTPFLRFVYLSKCKIDLRCIFRNSQKRFLWTGLVCTKFRYKLSAEHSTHINTKGLFLAPGSSRTMFSIILRHNSKRITRVREEIHWKKNVFFRALPEWWGGVYPCPNFLALFLEVHFWSIKRVYFFKNANVLNFFKTVF